MNSLRGGLSSLGASSSWPRLYRAPHQLASFMTLIVLEITGHSVFLLFPHNMTQVMHFGPEYHRSAAVCSSVSYQEARHVNSPQYP